MSRRCETGSSHKKAPDGIDRPALNASTVRLKSV